MRAVRPVAIALLILKSTVDLRSEGGDYLKEIKPLLRDRCYACHGALKQKHDLRLDTVAGMLKGGKDGPVIHRGKPTESPLIQRITAANPEERMPPEHEGEPLSAAQVDVLRAWIAAGAPAPADEVAEKDPREHWAFREIVRPPLPASHHSNWVRNPIDAFIARQHAQRDLKPQPEASREVLVRRLYFDLIGLPPTPDALAAARQSNSDLWFEETVDRLLDDPRHGERWARHWMDIWRYSDWWGLGDQLRNSQKHMWHWRDWIIESLNADTPYDEMVRLMLAADELSPKDLDRLRASGFLARNWFLFNRHQWLEETVEHVGKSFLGLTINCAKCHDHKYDPIRQEDFYRMRAFFEPYHVRLDVLPGEGDLEKNGLPRPFDGLLDAPTYRFVRGQENQPDKSVIIAPGVPALLAFEEPRIQPVRLPVEAYQPERRAWIIETYMAAARRSVGVAESPIPALKVALATALREEADLLVRAQPQRAAAPAQPSQAGALTREQARRNVEEARSALSVAEARLDSAKADHASVERRAEAMRASWATADGAKQDPGLAALEREKAMAAVTAEREAAAAKARLTLAEAGDRLLKASVDKAEPIEKEVKKARETLEQAIKTAAAPVKPDEPFTPLAGARWTPTRFLNSTADDPAVPFPAQSSGRRKALAGWITDRRNPLTARVAVNHIWARHFGSPLVATVFEFGRKGTPPANPELLDWLAAEFIESGWSMKHLHRLMVTSSAYRMSSSLAGGEASAGRDPDNIHLWRRMPIRLEAEAVRDAILSLAGTLDLCQGGPAVPPGEQEISRRRSLYFFQSNNDRNLFLTTFDQAAVKECYRRDQSIVPQQALALSNSKLVLDASPQIAARLSHGEAPEQSQSVEDAFIRRAFAAVLGMIASDAELAASKVALQKWRALEPPTPGKADPARAHFVWALLNHNDFVTLR